MGSLLTMCMGEAFELFQSKHSNLSIGSSKLFGLRPNCIREDYPHEVCVCTYHENADLLLKVSPNLEMTGGITLFSISGSVEQLEEH